MSSAFVVLPRPHVPGRASRRTRRHCCYLSRVEYGPLVISRLTSNPLPVLRWPAIAHLVIPSRLLLRWSAISSPVGSSKHRNQILRLAPLVTSRPAINLIHPEMRLSRQFLWYPKVFLVLFKLFPDQSFPNSLQAKWRIPRHVHVYNMATVAPTLLEHGDRCANLRTGKNRLSGDFAVLS